MESHLNLILAPNFGEDRPGSPYLAGNGLNGQAAASLRSDLELRLKEGGLNLQTTLRTLSRTDPLQGGLGNKGESHGILNQLYVDGSLSEGWGYTLGKKVLSWGVGFGFRPLDVIQRENRRDPNPPALVGVPVLALEQFGTDTAWSLVASRPEDRDHGLALRAYQFEGEADRYGVVRVSRRRHLELGLGANRVVGAEWSLYGAYLYQRVGYRLGNRLLDTTVGAANNLYASSDPLLLSAGAPASKAVLGAQWTGSGGWSVLGEAFYDGEAWRRADWQNLDALTARQISVAQQGAILLPSLALDANRAWSSQAFLSPNLLRENLLLRLSYDDSEGFKPYLEILYTPRDGGRVMTLAANWEADRHRFTLGLRQLGGPADAAYARSPSKGLLWAQWTWAVF